MEQGGILWKDRKRTFLGLPWSFTRYSLSTSRFYLKTGLFTTREEELLLYRVMDLTLTRTLGQRMLGLGSIVLTTADKTHPQMMIKNIKKSEVVRAQISALVEQARQENRVSSREYFSADGCDHEDGPLDV